MATIAVDDSENLEKAIKRFKRMVEKEGIIREYKKPPFLHRMPDRRSFYGNRMFRSYLTATSF